MATQLNSLSVVRSGWWFSFGLRKFILLLVSLVASLVAGCGGSEPQTTRTAEDQAVSATQDPLLVATASNFAATLLKLKPAFESATGYELRIASGSSGKLYAQIVAGAPYDIFLSADEERPQKLAGIGLATKPFTYARGRLALWAPVMAGQSETNMPATFEVALAQQLAHPSETSELGRIAVANPALAPYGRATKETLTAMGLLDVVEPHLVFGENIGQVHLMIATGNASFGFTSNASLYLTDSTPSFTWLVPEHLHAPIVQQGAMLTQSTNQLAASAFKIFLTTASAQSIILASGYGASF